MPCATQSRRASAAGSWPGSSPSGRLLTIVFTPEAASASISTRVKAPAAARPGASSINGVMGSLRKAKRAAELQPVADPSPEKWLRRLRRVLPRPLHQIAGADPEPLEPAQGHRRRRQILVGNRGLVQHLDVALMHFLHPVAQLGALLRPP